MAGFNFPATSAGDTLARVQVLTLPAEATLRLGDSAVTVNQSVTTARLDAESLWYMPPADASAADYTSVFFSVRGSRAISSGNTVGCFRHGARV